MLITAGILLGVLASYLYINQDALIKPVVAEINKSLLVPVKVAKMGLSLRKFPNASLRFQGVFCPENHGNKTDTLFVLDDFFVQLSLWDMLQGKYVIKKLSLERGSLTIKQFKDGQNNFGIFKPNEEGSGTSISLNSISLREVKIFYLQEESGLITTQFLHFAELKGDFSGNLSALGGELKAQNIYLDLPGIHYSTALSYQGKFAFTLQEDVVHLESDKFTFNDQKASLLIHLEPRDKRVLIKGEELDIQKIWNILPQEYQGHIGDLQVDGVLKLSLLLAENEWNEWGLKSAFIWNAKRTFLSERNLELGNSYLKGSLEKNASKKFKNGFLQLESFNIQSGSSQYQGSFSVENFDRPFLKLSTQFTASAEDLYKLNSIEGIQGVGGIINGDLNFENQFANLSNISKKDFTNLKTQGNLEVQNLDFSIDAHPIQIPKGRFSWQGNTLQIEPTRIVNDQNDLVVEGVLNSFLSFIFIENEVLSISGKLKSNYLNPEKWFKSEGAEAQDSDPYQFSLPARISLNLEVNAERFEMDRFQGERIGFHLYLENQRLKLKNFRANSMEGSVLSQIEIDAHNMPIQVAVLGEMEKLELKNVFYTFYNFGQQTLTEKEISGKLSGDFQLVFTMNQELEIDLNKLESTCNLELIKGRLVNFEPMNALSRFAKVEELADIRFSELKNEIRIRNGSIEIPKMKIESNVMLLDLAGHHSFDNTIEYQLGLQLRDVLFAQRKKKSSDLDDLIFETDNEGAMLYVLMSGSVDEPKLSLDKTRYREKMKSDWRENANPFKKPVEDTLKKPKPKYQIEWDED